MKNTSLTKPSRCENINKVIDIKAQLDAMESQVKETETKSSQEEKRLSHLEGDFFLDIL